MVTSSTFVVDERMIRIEISGLLVCAWGSSAFKKVANQFDKFKFFDDDIEGHMSKGRACIAIKIQALIFEKVNVTINGEIFQAHVKEIGTWSIHISNDLESNDSNNDRDFEEHRSINENVDPNETPDDFVKHMVEDEDDVAINDEATLRVVNAGDFSSSDTIKDEHIITHKKNLSKEDVSDISKPSGFKNFFKENNKCFRSSNSSRSGTCSTSFGNYKRKGLKGFSFFDERNRMIEVGGDLGYDVKGCKKSLRRMINRIVRSESERFGFIFSSGDVTIFNDFIHATGLIDLPMGGRIFTWMNKVGSKMSKLDRFLLSNYVIQDISNLQKKMDDGHAFDEDKTIRIIRLQELDNLENIESMDLVHKARVKWEMASLLKSEYPLGRSQWVEWKANLIILFLILLVWRDEILGSDSCIWNLSNDDTFSVNKVRKHIDERSLPMLSPSTCWYKIIPKKVNIFL
uniref:RNA-directed DNA polymerase, eukaryota n=1 Tax=Tanacetum cinerariifolium TaxID=118510 RepID=A0A699GQQ2_TANCI|nr:RNA-directed DNA polymerase, eukaryota [Tanacetum cinerariifolium]